MTDNQTLLDYFFDYGKEVDITVDQLKELVPGAKSVPQIMEDNVLIGGYDDLVEYLNRPAGARRC